MKKLLCGVLAMTMVLGLTLPMESHAKAQDVTRKTGKYFIVDNHIEDRYGYIYDDFTSGTGDEVDLEDALNVLNGIAPDTDEEDANMDLLRAPVDPDYGITITQINKKVVGKEMKATPDVVGPCSIDYTEGVTVSASLTTGISFEMHEAIFDFVSMEYNVDICIETAESKSYTVHGDAIKKGYKGALYFKPYYITAKGSYQHSVNTRKSFNNKYPKIENGFADGMYYIKQKKVK